MMRAIIVLFLCFLIFVIFGQNRNEEVKATPKQKATISTSEQLIENQFSKWDGSHNNLVKVVKSGMNDPKSFEHIETTYIDKDGFLIVKMNFRGKNAFGGIVQNSVYAMVGSATGEVYNIEYH